LQQTNDKISEKDLKILLLSKEIEDLLIQHPHVADAAAIAKPDERFGERIAVFVQTMPGLTIDLAEIIAHFERLGVARQKTPEYLQIVDALPRSLSGKVRKVELRDQLRLLK
jgi:acyl-CoA synthetase (AMP-forming)/AMP-acid ligase II